MILSDTKFLWIYNYFRSFNPSKLDGIHFLLPSTPLMTWRKPYCGSGLKTRTMTCVLKFQLSHSLTLFHHQKTLWDWSVFSECLSSNAWPTAHLVVPSLVSMRHMKSATLAVQKFIDTFVTALNKRIANAGRSIEEWNLGCFLNPRYK